MVFAETVTYAYSAYQTLTTASYVGIAASLLTGTHREAYPILKPMNSLPPYSSGLNVGPSVNNVSTIIIHPREDGMPNNTSDILRPA